MTTFAVVPTGDGVSRQVLADHAEMMVVSFKFQKNAEGALHHHPHVQSTFVKSGQFRFSMDNKEFVVSAGESFIIPSNAVHGCVCLEDGELIDCFTPRRDDFL